MQESKRMTHSERAVAENKAKRLPKKLWALIEIALADLRKVEADDRYRVDMMFFHGTTYDERCLVCLGGSVMSGSCAVAHDVNVDPEDFGSQSWKFMALDHLRLGDVHGALSLLMNNKYKGFNVCPSHVSSLLRSLNISERYVMTPYDMNRRAFFREMRALARRLKKVNL